MKKLIKIGPVLLAIVLFTSCKWLFPPVIPTLPPETQTGENTFGCYINGELFLNNVRWAWGNNLEVWYVYDLLADSTTFIIRSDYNDENQQIVKRLIFTLDTNIVVNEKVNEFLPIKKVEYTYVGGGFRVESNNVSSIIFTKIDTINHILSGRFEFDLVKGNGDTLKFTEGRFDCEFYKY